MPVFVIDVVETSESYRSFRMTTMLIVLDTELKYTAVHWSLVRCL